MASQLCSNCGQPLGPGDVFCLNCGFMVKRKDTSAPMDLGAEVVPTLAPISSVVSASEGTAQTSLGGTSPRTQTNTLVADVGTSVAPAFCPECGKRVKSHWLFCMNCGQKLATINRKEHTSTQDVREPSASVSHQGEEVSPHAVQGLRVTTKKVSIDSFDSANDIVGALDVGPSIGDSFDRMDAGDDALTIVYDDEDNIDAPTTIFDGTSASKSYSLIRRRTGETYLLDLPVTLGKGSAASIRIVGSRIISRVHAKIYELDGQLMIEDNASTNGTLVNGVQIMPGNPVALQPGDVVTLADEEFEIIVS